MCTKKHYDILFLFVFIFLFTGCCGMSKESRKNYFEINDKIGFELVDCPAGTFMMGSSKDEIGHLIQEQLHQVTLTKDFKIGKHEVTQGVYEAVMGKNPSRFKDSSKPVECVSWNDAMAFCDKLNQMLASKLPKGYKFALPTEAQWEYACRAGTKTAFNNGKSLDKAYNCDSFNEIGWHCDNSGKTTHIVGQKKPNEWGIYDMHGNVWELCRDYFVANFKSDSVTDPYKKTPLPCYGQTIRGGAYNDPSFSCRSACRQYFYKPSINIGFRIALVQDE